MDTFLAATTSSFPTSITTTAALVATAGESFQIHYLWALVLAFHLSFLFAFAMGANEVSNAFATSVGSGVISLKVAYFMATIVESAGSTLLGYKVLETIRFKVVDLTSFEHQPGELLLGQLAILAGGASCKVLAVLVKLPVSSTHAHIGGIIGFWLVARGTSGLQISTVLKIVISWIASPALSGLVSVIIYIIVDFGVLRRKEPLKCGLRALPILYFLVFAFNTFIVVFEGSKWIHFDKTPFWLALLISFGVGSIAAILFQLIIRPYVVKWVHRENKNSDHDHDHSQTVAEDAGHYDREARLSTPESFPQQVVHAEIERQHFQLSPSGFIHWLLPNKNRVDDPKTLRLFSAIQVFSGCFTGFSHGSKDIPNTIAALATLFFIYDTVNVPKPQETPIWYLIYGSFGTCVGFWMMGHRVIKTVGKKLTDINSYCGFTVEMGAALTVVIASKLGIPISLSLCIVGSIVAVGTLRGFQTVNWKLFRNSFIAWIVTAPLAGVVSAVITLILKGFF